MMKASFVMKFMREIKKLSSDDRRRIGEKTLL